MKSVLLSFKALGDFVIAYSAFRQHQQKSTLSESFEFYAGAHLRDLAKAIHATDVQFLAGSGQLDVPAIFDIRKKGTIKALQSALHLRKQLANFPATDTLIFDRLGFRERYLGGGHSLQELPLAPNIYLAYDQFFQNQANVEKTKFNFIERQKCLIIPTSRIQNKVLQKGLVATIAKKLEDHGIEHEILMFQDEALDLPSQVSVRSIPKTFEALVKAIQSASLVVSADSLPAHIAEYHQIPIFVFTPTANTYWLPRTSFLNAAWTDFSNMRPLETWLLSNPC